MILPKIEERTLYAPIIILHKQHWFESNWENNGNHKTPDILFQMDSTER